jgi:PIN domain nuclease of toxin-antitoxin system
MKGLLLDTHVWIWLVEGISDLSSKHQKLIIESARHNQVCIAAISMWEVSMLAMKERIILEKPVLAWIQEAADLPGIEIKPLSPEIAAESCQLPDDFHGDPADRLIVATARLHSLTLLTHDEKILNYAKKQYISVVPV